MFGALVIADAHAGTLTRYEIPSPLRKTHFWDVPAEYERPVVFLVDVVEEFRRHGHEDCYVGPPLPLPTGPGTPPAPLAPAMVA